MEKPQFRILYREFLFRIVDLELIAPQGDMNRLLGQFAGLLVFFSSVLALGMFLSDSSRVTARWGMEHFLIKTTMLAVGLFAVLSWDSTFPDRRDVLILAPLPIRSRTLFLAKAAASATALGVTVLALNALTGLAWPLILTPANYGLLDLILSPDYYRSFAAYWITMAAAGAFLFGAVLAIQGWAALLPRKYFLRLSAFLQMAAFCLFLCVYFLEPSLAAPENPHLPAWPSYWFLGLFQELNGSMRDSMLPLAHRAWIGLAIAGFLAAAAFLVSYLRTLRNIVEEPDILPDSRRLHLPLTFGNSLETAVVQFTARTILRSRQHRVMLAFYVGLGLSIAILLMRISVTRWHATDSLNIPLLFSSIVMMCVCVLGMRVVFSMPLALKANWVFRVTETRAAAAYAAAIRRPLFVLAVAPVWAASAALFLSIWPWRLVAGHLIVLGLFGMTLAYLCLRGFHKIPFTCSYLPGKSRVNMAAFIGVGFLLLMGHGVEWERQALQNPAAFTRLLLALSAALFLARRLAVANATDETVVQFEDVELPAIEGLGLHRDGVLAIEPDR